MAFYLKINELPMKERGWLAIKILAAIWFGEVHPSVNTFLKPFHDTMLKLFRDGITVKSPDVSHTFVCRAIVLSGTADMPAKALALNTIGHNGFFGCHKCLQPGVNTKNTERTCSYLSICGR